MLASALATTFACSEATEQDSGQLDGQLVGAGGKADDPNTLPLASHEIRSRADFEARAFSGSGLVVMGRSMKFLIDLRDPRSPAINYMNSGFREHGERPQSSQYHFFFAKAILSGFRESIATFNDATYWADTKKYVAGTIQEYRLNGKTVFGIQLYPQDVGKEDTILTIVKTVASSFSIPDSSLAFVASGPQQTTDTVADDLEALGVDNRSVESILGDINYLPMNVGEAWGYLRMFPEPDALLGPTDIPVFEELPLELSVVAGVMTRSLQDASSHVNLKSKERGTPDMVLRDAGPDNELLKRWIDKPIHLVVGPDGFQITATSRATVEEKLRQHLDRPWTEMPVVDEERMLSFREMCPEFSSECLELDHHYGSKATHLGFLQSRQVLGHAGQPGSLSEELGYDLVPQGFALPLTHYREFVELPANAELKDKIDAFVELEKTDIVTPQERQARIREIKELFYHGQFPDGRLQEIETELSAVMPAGLRRIKLRSSANAEDIPNFDGAGLYNSFTAVFSQTDLPDGSCSEEIDSDGDLRIVPRTVNCGIKGVYASLWNQRAVEERNFARLDHATAAMGVAIVPSYDFESDVAANSVVITRVVSNGGISGYTFSVQEGNVLVTNPPAGTISEQTIAAFLDENVANSFILTRHATPALGAPARTTPILSVAQQEEMLRIARQVEEAYCRAEPSYYNGNCDQVTVDPGKPTALDMEFKILENGHFVCKQVREFAGSDLDNKADDLGDSVDEGDMSGCNSSGHSGLGSALLLLLACLALGRARASRTGGACQ